MEEHGDSIIRQLFCAFKCYLRKLLVAILAVGPIPYHIAFIMDGNRRYAKKRNLAEGEGHKHGFVNLLTLLGYCYEFGVKCVTVYAFSIDNFRRKPEIVQYLMDMMQEKIGELLQEENLVNEYGIRIRFIGNLTLLSEPVRVSVDRAIKATAHNDKRELLICVAYTSTDEIVHAVEESCKSKLMNGNCKNSNNLVLGRDDENKSKADGSESSSLMSTGVDRNKDKQIEVPIISLVDIEKHLYMGVVPDPDILIRTGGEVRLSNFLLWQTCACPLYSPSALWPELGLRHLVWGIIKFQRSYRYMEKKKKLF